MRLIPPEASVSAQGTLLPHVSQRRDVWEFPELRGADFVVVDPSLPMTAQSRAAGYDVVLDSLSGLGYTTVFSHGRFRILERGGRE